jgi:hypothetical protein
VCIKRERYLEIHAAAIAVKKAVASSTFLKNISATRHVKGAWVGNYLSPEARRLERVADHSPPCSEKIKNGFFLRERETATKEEYLPYSVKSSSFYFSFDS